MCSFVALVAWFGLFLFHSYTQVLCKQGKRHQVCGGPCVVVVTREIKEECSLGLSDLFYRGSVSKNLVSVEEVTKIGSISTLSLSQTIT